MAKYKLQEMSDVHHTGKRKVYPKMVVNRTLSRKEFIERMQGYHRGISASTTEAVLMDVEEILVEMLSMGYNVNLEGLGTFSLSLGFEDDKPTEMQGDDDKMTSQGRRKRCELQGISRFHQVCEAGSRP